MQENTLNTGQKLQQVDSKKDSKTIIIILAILASIALLAIVAFTAYTYGKNQGKEESTTSSDDTQEEDNEASDSETTTTTTSTTIKTDTTEESDPYESWTTYTNNEYGFSFKYPDDWSIEAEGGTPYTDPSISDSNVGEGFSVILSNSYWSFIITYEPYIDDVTGGTIPIDIKELQIGEKTRTRVIYDEYDNATGETLNRLFIGGIMETSYYEEHKDSSYWASSIELNNKSFTIIYSPQDNFTLEESTSNIAILDKIAESLEVF